MAPSLALEFRKAQCCSLENVPKQLLKLVEEASQGKKHEKNEAMKIFTFRGHEVDEKKCEVNEGKKEAGGKAYTFTLKEVERIEKAIANKEDPMTLAMEMGRTYRSVSKNLAKLEQISKQASSVKRKIQESSRLWPKMKITKKVAKELRRDPRTVQTRMLFLNCNPKHQQGKKIRE